MLQFTILYPTYVPCTCRGDEDRGQPWEAVDADESMWCLEDDEDEAGNPIKSLMISLVRPAPTESEITWKKGK